MTSLAESDLDDILEFSISLAKKAGTIILEGSKAIRERLGASNSEAINSKINSVDLVTEWDVRVEEIVNNEIKERYPTFGFIGEESYSKGIRPPLTDDPTFCVDPIDGTTNFIHGFPFACISIGLIYRKKPVIGVIYNPFLDQLYSAVSTKGAYLNRTTRLPLTAPSPLPSISSALIGVEWGSSRSAPIMERKSRSFVRLAGNFDEGVVGGRMAHSLRSIGSAALNYCFVASGSLDIYWQVGCW
ncbi:hypothetical protein FRC02_006555 [Tulasnella sp. 418]|nr:hypothetical protein FRC02_006555 [Tulasnella sp. 418]